ncbi:MAG: hypothetical protein P8M50_06815 [Paracoccaceae bacterium]|nr:hypothetical protein [Paracoccaceae bacterium]
MAPGSGPHISTGFSGTSNIRARWRNTLYFSIASSPLYTARNRLAYTPRTIVLVSCLAIKGDSSKRRALIATVLVKSFSYCRFILIPIHFIQIYTVLTI